MHTLLLATLLLAPPWVSDLELQPAPAKKITLAGSAVPNEAVPMPPKKRASLKVTLDAPGEVTVRAWGLMKKVGRRTTDPGKLTIRVGKGSKKTLELSDEPLDGVSVLLRSNWRVGYASQIKLKLGAGSHKITVAPSRKAAQGYLLQVDAPASASAPVAAVEPSPASEPEITAAPPPPPTSPPTLAAEPPASEPELAVAPSDSAAEPASPPAAPASTPTEPAPADAAPPPDTPPAVPPPPPEDDLPPLIGSPTDAEPDLVMSPGASPASAPGLQIVGVPLEIAVQGPDGNQPFRRIDIEQGLKLTVTGPGAVILDIHAHRAEVEASSLEPLVVGLLLDDVLVKTLAIDQPASDRFHAEGTTFALSDRVTVRVSIPMGVHSLQLSLSDNALLGASVRPRFIGLGDPEEPFLLDPDSAREGDLLVRAPAAEVRGGAHLGLLIGTWLPSSLSTPGAGLALDASLDLPTLARGLGVGASFGFARVEASRRIEDPRKPDGEGRLRILLTSVPLLADVRWTMQLPVESLRATLGVGGGVVLAWTTTRSRLGVANSGLRAAAAGTAHGGISYRMGPGELLLRAALIAGQPWSAENIRDFDPGAVMVSLGYGIGLGSDE